MGHMNTTHTTDPTTALRNDELDHLIALATALRNGAIVPADGQTVSAHQLVCHVNRLAESVDRIKAWTPQAEA